MAWSTEFEELMTTTVTAYAWSAFDGYGDPTFATTGTSYPCRIRQTPVVIVTGDNETITSDTQLVVHSTVALAATAKYVLGGTTAALMVKKVQRCYDEDGLHHNMLFLGAG